MFSRGRGGRGRGRKPLPRLGLRSPRRFPAADRPRAPPPVESPAPRPSPSRSAPSRVCPVPPRAPAPCRPRAARSRRPPARDTPAARRGPCGPVAGREHRGPEHPRASIPGPSAHEKTPCPVEGAGGRDRRRREAYALPFAARASVPFAVANSAHRVTASGFSSIHARRYAHSAGSPEIPRVG